MMHFIAFHNDVYLFRILRSSQILSFKRQTEDANQRMPTSGFLSMMPL